MVNAINISTKVTLNNGIDMPLLGLGVYNMHGREAEDAVAYALETGYRLIDTAAMYQNETEIGHAVKRSSIPRSDIFITTKVNNADQGFESTLKAFETSMNKLQVDYVDLYLVHWPLKKTRKDTWKALEKIYAGGRARAIGVANYLVPFLEELATYSDLVPALNQVEFSPYLYQDDLLSYCRKHAVQLQAYSPLVRGQKMSDPRLQKLAEKYNKTPAQIILRWDIELGVSAIPKSSSPKRLKENFDIFDFTLSQEDVDWMKTFDDRSRVADDPVIFL
ncbi:MAG TPA: aldo/keto reductase [Puia sp.]|nr:aldo/keto reductase [Puia sp.]